MIIAGLFVANNIVNAKQSEEFINYLANKIYNDCKNEDLVIKENPLFRFKEGVSEIVFIEIESLKSDNYNKETLKEILQMFSSREPFGRFMMGDGEKRLVGIVPCFNFIFNSNGEEKKILNDGRNMLMCGENVLDINENNYYWNNEKVVLPRNSFTLFGINFMSIGGIAIFGFSLFEIFSITAMAVVIIRIKKVYYIINKVRTRIFIRKK